MIFSKKNGQKTIGERRRLANDPNSQKVVSYYTASRKQLDSFERNNISSDRSSKSRKYFIKFKKKGFWPLACFILFGLALYLSTLSTSATLSVKGISYRSNSSYMALVEPLLKSSFKYRFKLLITTGDLETKLAQAVPEAVSVKVSTTIFGRRPIITVTTAEPLAIFGQNNSSSIIISDRGKLLLYSDKSQMNIQSLPTITNDSGITGLEGQQFLSPKEADAVRRLINQFKAENSIVTYSIPTSPNEIFAKESGRGYKIRFLLDDTIVNQFGAMRATQNQLKKIAVEPKEYLDVRLVEKVYYR